MKKVNLNEVKVDICKGCSNSTTCEQESKVIKCNKWEPRQFLAQK